jgi:hypothetical protein
VQNDTTQVGDRHDGVLVNALAQPSEQLGIIER